MTVTEYKDFLYVDGSNNSADDANPGTKGMTVWEIDIKSKTLAMTIELRVINIDPRRYKK